VYPTPHLYTAELVTPLVDMLNDAPGEDDSVEQATIIHDTDFISNKGNCKSCKSWKLK
jgi:hypothetical protein